MADAYFKSLQKKDKEGVQDFIQSGNSAFQWNPSSEKSSIHYLCQYFDKEVFDYVWSKLKVETDLHTKWHKRDGRGRYPQHVLAQRKDNAEVKMQVKTCFELLKNHDWGEGLEFDLGEDLMNCTCLDYAKDAENEALIDFLNDEINLEFGPERQGTFTDFWNAIEAGSVEDCQKYLLSSYLKKEGPNGSKFYDQESTRQFNLISSFWLLTFVHVDCH